MPNHAIVAENLTYRYGNLLAVDHINFDVAEGEILGFIGPNGAGKTTTVKMLTGQMRPKDGKATVLGMDISQKTESLPPKPRGPNNSGSTTCAPTWSSLSKPIHSQRMILPNSSNATTPIIATIVKLHSRRRIPKVAGDCSPMMN